MSAEPVTWTDACTAVCRQYPDLVSVHEGPGGRLALLLRYMLLTPRSERPRRRREIREIGACIVAALRTAGVAAPITLLQLRPPGEVAHVLDHWVRRYDGDPERREELTRSAGRLAADQRFTITRRRLVRAPLLAASGSSGTDEQRLQATLIRWYGEMAPTWLTIEPLLRRRLVLRAHQWLTESVFTERGIRVDVLEDLSPSGRLAAALTELVPASELERWRPWIRLVLHDFRRALRWPPGRRTEAWCRWLFLIPYGVPGPLAVSDIAETQGS
jgi:hypothetical protein